MKIGFCTNICDGLFEIKEKIDCMICCGNFSPIYDKELLTFNIINQADWIEEHLNKWMDRYPDVCFIFNGGPNDHVAKFYGPNINYYMRANYVQDDTLIFKNLKIYCTPWLPVHHIGIEPSAFTARDSSLYVSAIESIPNDTDILVTWNHAYGHKNCKDIIEQGDVFLKKKIQSLKNLKIHAFGQYVEDNVIQGSNSHLVVCSNRGSVGPYTIVEI